MVGQKNALALLFLKHRSNGARFFSLRTQVSPAEL